MSGKLTHLLGLGGGGGGANLEIMDSKFHNEVKLLDPMSKEEGHYDKIH